MVNSASVDMEEHDWIPRERKVFLSDPERGKLEGTAKNAAIGHAIDFKLLRADVLGTHRVNVSPLIPGELTAGPEP
ncbi:hypothetical protein J2T17_005005 [Paenibacillus mucilaginosus]|uniref:hypothetical protein n=1 Tax=Paenibacillus mucilaginosus TaxID=61624 RepID=UPI003D226493